MRLAVVLVLLAGSACKKVERYSDPETSSPTWGQTPTVTPSPSPSPSPSPAPTVAPTPIPPAPPPPPDCVATQVDALTAIPEDRDDCTTGNDKCKTDCDGGNASACFFRATVLQSLPDRADEAITLFGKACVGGLAIACTNHGASLWTSREDEATSRCARAVFEKACAVKEPFACGMIGRMLVKAARDDGQRAAARLYLQKTCDELSGPPCKMLATALQSNTLGPYDGSTIRALLQRACDGGDPSACADLGRAAP